MKIAFASDHGGYLLKQHLLRYLQDKGYETVDFGCFGTESCDYADYAFPACEAVVRGEFDRAILICKTGIGMSICANKVYGIRCALCDNTETAKMTREHNDSNVLAMGDLLVTPEKAEGICDIWLTTEFLGGRHARRIGKIQEYERNRGGLHG